MAAKEPAEETPTEETGRPARDGSASPPGASPSPEKPLLMVDIDGVISLFVGFAGHAPWATGPAGPDGCRYETIDGIPHCLSRTAAAHLLELTAEFEPVWASGWEEKAEENLPRLLGLPAGLPFLRFERSPGRGNAHWKLAAIDEHAGSRPLAWIDDAFNDSCHAWARARPAPTLLVQTVPEHGLTSREASRLTTWAQSLAPPPAAARDSRAPEVTPRR